MVSEIGGLGAEILLGFLQDLIGRKVLTVAGMMIASISVICKPLPNHLVGLYCLRFCTNMGLIPIMYTPFAIDYVHKDSLSITAGVMSIVGVFASITSTSGVLYANKYWPIQYIYFAVGGFGFLVSVFMIFFLKDVYADK